MVNSLDIEGKPSDTRVVVAMSGGVDSSVVAGLLKEQGYDVIGVTMQLYDHGEVEHRPGACCAGQDIYDARQAADLIGIPHYVLNYEQNFRAKVIDAFAQSYAEGETPIPCVACNSQIKFIDLFGMARDLGADILATGHYIASRAEGEDSDERALFRALDADRDQSYFLFSTTREQLRLLRFPLGEMSKPEVRDHARRFGLAVAEKPDSQDICFVPTGRYSDLVERLAPQAATPGEIVHVDGRVLGRHAGVMNYTIGQRKGLGLGASANVGGAPLYVVRIDAAQARVTVGPREALSTKRVALRDVNWIGPGSLDEALESPRGREIAARVRSTRAPAPAAMARRGDEIWVEFVEDESGVAPGQACVFYEDAGPRARVLGGGFIRNAEPAQEEPATARKRA